jgi:hypothetical protein
VADIQTQLPVKLTNNTNTAAITSGNALQVDLGATTANSTPIVVTGSGTAGSAATGVITVQGIASGTAVAISGTVTANAGTGNFNVVGTLTTNNAAPGANNLGVLPAVASTAAPSYTTGNQVLLSTDLSGNLRTTATISGTTAFNLTQVGGSAIALGQTTMSASLPVTFASNQSNLVVVGNLTNNNAAPTTTNIGALVAAANSTPPTYTNTDQVLLQTDLNGNLKIVAGQNAATSGTITTSSSAITVATVGYNAVTVSVNGTYAGVNFTFEASDDGGTTYYNVAAARLDNTAVNTTSGVITNQSAIWTAYIGATTNFRVRATAYTSGTANIHLTPTVIAASPAVIATVSSGSTNITQIAGNAITTAAAGMQKVGIADSSGSAITLGQNTMANSLPVAIASNQSTLTVAGTLTNNNAAPTTTNFGVLPALCNTAAPTWTNGDQTLLSVDTSGNLRVSVTSTSGTSAVNLTQVGGSAIALGQTTMSASIPVAIASNQSNLTVVGAGTAGTPSGGVVSVQGVAGGTAVPVSGTVTANAGTGTFTVAGGLTNNNAAPSTNNIGALVAAANSTPPTYTNTDQVLLQTDLNGNLKIVAGQNAATSGTITTSASTVTVAMAGYNGVVVSVNGTYAGVNFTFEASDDGGTTYYTVAAARSDNSAVQTSTGVLTANSSIMWDVYTGSVTNFRVRATAYTSGTANIHLTPGVISQDPAVISTVSGTSTVVGSLTNNNAAPAANNLGVLPALCNTAAPTFTNGNQTLLSVDTSGNLRTTATISGTTAFNLAQVGGSAIALGQTTTSASLPVTIASNQSNLVVVGNLTHNNAAPTTTNIGALVAVASTSAPTYTNTDQVLLSTDLAGNLRIAGAGTAGTPSGGVVSIQGVASGTVVPISGTVTANAGTGTFTVSGTVTANAGTGTFTVAGGLTNNNAAPSANNVGVLPALCNTAAPTWTNGDQTLLSVDTSGNLRVSVSSTGGTTTVAGNLTNNNAAPGANNLGVLPAIASTAAQSYTTGDQVLLSTDLAGNLRTFNTGPATGIVTSYTDTASVASGSTGTATYTTSGSGTFHLTQIIASSSGGPCRVQVDYGAGPTIIFVGFYASSSPFLTVNFATPILIAASTAVNVKIQNNAGASQDVYATLIGYQTT